LKKPDLSNVRLVPQAEAKPATLKQQLEAEITTTENARGDAPCSNGGDWHHLSTDEAEVFDINPWRFARMLKTFACYETFKGIAHDSTWDDDLIAEARQQHPEWCDKQIYTCREFQAFAKEFGGLTFREAHAMFYKQTFWNVRVGVTSFTDEVDKG
jgi:hypothetical protein